MTLPKIIGISGKKRNGKDTAADYLVVEHHYIKVSFADSLKGAARLIFGLNYDQLYGDKKEVIDPFWNDTPRNMLQRLGTECLRQGYHNDVWVKSLFRRIENEVKANPEAKFVIPDVRFPNEADAVKAAGGVNWRIHRPSVASTDNHPSETALDQWTGFDAFLKNDGPYELLGERIEGALSRYLAVGTFGG